MPAAPAVATRQTRSQVTNSATALLRLAGARRRAMTTSSDAGAGFLEGGVRRAPALDAADVLGLHRPDLLEEPAAVGVEMGIERVRRDDLPRRRLAHEPGGQVERLADEADVRARERPPRQEPERPHADADVHARGRLHAVERSLPRARHRVARLAQGARAAEGVHGG